MSFQFPLKVKIAAFVSALFFTAILLLARNFDNELQKDFKTVLLGQQLAATEYVADSIGNAIAMRGDSLRLFAGAIKPEWLASPEYLAYYLKERESMVRLFQAGLFVASPDGIILADYPVIAGRKGRSIAQRDYFQNALATGTLALGKPFMAPSTQRPVLTWGAPIKDDQGRVVGVLGASALIAQGDLFAEVAARSSRNLGDIHVISPKDGSVIVSTDETLNLAAADSVGLNEIRARLQDGWEGADLLEDAKGMKTLVSGKHVPHMDWVVISTLPAAAAFAPINENIAIVYRDAVIAAVLVALLSWLFLRQQLNPLTRAAHALKEIASGRVALQSIPETGGLEIRDMIGSFNHLQRQISDQEKRLRDGEERWKFALEGAGDGVWDRNLQTDEVVYSKRYKEMYGFAEDELEDRTESWHARVHPDDVAQVEASRQAYAEGKSEVYANERRMQCKDGSWKWVLVRGMTIKSAEDGTPLRMIGTHTDITERKQSQKQLEESEARFRQMFEGNPSIAFLIDAETGLIVDANAAALAFWGYTRAQLQALLIDDINVLSREQLRADLQRVTAGEKVRFEWQQRKRSGAIRDVEVYCSPFDFQGITLLYSIAHDITERREQERSLRLAATVYESVEDGVAVTDADNRIISVNPAFTHITGYAFDEVVGRNPRFLSSGSNPPKLYQSMWQALADTGSWRGDVLNRRKSGEIYIQSLSVKQVCDDQGHLLQYVGVFSDITAQKLAEQRLHHQAQHDVLTDLPNRTLLNDRLQQAIAKARRDRQHIALMYIDLDKFKPVNDTYGHAVGDALLRAVAKRMLECTRESDTVARVGGDEFVVLLPSIEAAQDAMLVAEKIRHAIHASFEVEGHSLSISTSIGMAVYPDHGSDETTLAENADAAMYRAKQSGRNQVQLFHHLIA